MPNLSEFDVAWIAGLLEGEGCFTFNKTCPCIILSMSDLDIVTKFRDLTSINTVTTRLPTRDNDRKVMYSTAVYSIDAVDLMKKLLPYMGLRRSERIKEIIVSYELRIDKGNYCKHGHRKYIRYDGKRLCKECESIWNITSRDNRNKAKFNYNEVGV